MIEERFDIIIERKGVECTCKERKNEKTKETREDLVHFKFFLILNNIIGSLL